MKSQCWRLGSLETVQLLAESPMDVHVLLTKCFFIFYIACLHIPSVESGKRLITPWQREAGWTSVFQPPPLMTNSGRQRSSLPEARQEYSYDAGATQGTDMVPLHGGFGGFTRKKGVKVGHVRHFGQFNSDTVSAEQKES